MGSEHAKRVERYITERGKMRRIDPELIHGLHAGDEREADLLLSDLRAILAENDRLCGVIEEIEATLDKYKEYAVVNLDANIRAIIERGRSGASSPQAGSSPPPASPGSSRK